MDDGKNVKSINIFCSYAHEDEVRVKKLVKHLRRNHIGVWHDREIKAGQDWERAIDDQLNTADIILLLLSADFMDSKYCFDTEMPRALERHNVGEACTIPVILRPVHWDDMELSRLNALPKDAKPVSSWDDEEVAFVNISTEIIYNANKILKKKYNDEAIHYLEAGKKEEACESCYLALTIPYREAALDMELGNRLHELEALDKALEAYESATRDENKDILTYLSILLQKGKIQFKLKEYENSFSTYTEAIKLIQKNSPPFKDKGDLYENLGQVLIELGRPDEALNAYQHAKISIFNSESSKEKRIALSREIARAFFKWADIKQKEGLEEFDSLINLWPEAPLKRNKANMAASFGQLEKALELYDNAISEFSNDAFLFKERGDTFLKLNRLTDALDDYNQAIYINPDYEKAKERKKEVLISLVKEQDKIAEILRGEE